MVESHAKTDPVTGIISHINGERTISYTAADDFQTPEIFLPPVWGGGGL